MFKTVTEQQNSQTLNRNKNGYCWFKTVTEQQNSQTEDLQYTRYWEFKTVTEQQNSQTNEDTFIAEISLRLLQNNKTLKLKV